MNAYNDYKQNRIDEAYMHYALMAEVGYEVAQSNAAFLLDREEVHVFNDRHEDLIRAFYYWKRAAGQGYSAAQVKLGDYYYYGWGTKTDFETAAALYRCVHINLISQWYYNRIILNRKASSNSIMRRPCSIWAICMSKDWE